METRAKLSVLLRAFRKRFLLTPKGCKSPVALPTFPVLTLPSFLHAYYTAKEVCEHVNVSGMLEAAFKKHRDANVIYAMTLGQIHGLPVAKKNLALRTLAWLTFAKKPFKENEMAEAFATDNRDGKVNEATQFEVENVIEYCRGLVVRIKTRQASFLRLAHMTAQEYFLQNIDFQNYHLDICLTRFSHLIACLPQQNMINQTRHKEIYSKGQSHKQSEWLGNGADDSESDSSLDDISEELQFSDAEAEDHRRHGEDKQGEDNKEEQEEQEQEQEGDQKNEEKEEDDDDDEAYSDLLFEDSESNATKESYRSWRSGKDVLPISLLHWITKETPFSIYAGAYALSHLKDSTLNPELDEVVLTLVKAANVRRRRSTFSSKLKDHQYSMDMLYIATFIGITSVVENMLDIPTTQIDGRDILGRTALMWALALGKESVAKTLLVRGAEVSAYDRRQSSTLTYTSTVKNEKLLMSLLQKCPKDMINARFFSSCAKASNVYLMNGAWFQRDFNLSDVNENGRAPLHEAVINGSEAAVNALIDHGAQVLIVGRNGYTPLAYAAKGQASSIAKALIQAGADPNSLNKRQETPLHLAVQYSIYNCLKVIQILVKAGANVCAEDEDGLVPLQVLIRAYHTSQGLHWTEKQILTCVKFVSADPISISHQDHDGANVLHDAVKCSYILILQYLISRAPPGTMNARKIHGQTPIFEALIADNVAAFDILVEIPDIDLLASRDDKETLLNCAAWASQKTVAQKLIKKAPQLIHLAEGHSISAIHYAVEKNRSPMLELLLNAGSDPPSRGHRFNQHLICYPAHEGRAWCLDALIERKAWMTYNPAGILVAHTDERRRNLLHEAASSGSIVVLEKIVSYLPLEGLSLEDKDPLGRTSLHLAALTGNSSLVGLLLTAGSNKDAITNTGDTPLDLALDFDASDVVQTDVVQTDVVQTDVVQTHVLSDAHMGRKWGQRSSKIQSYQHQSFFARLQNVLIMPISKQNNRLLTDLHRCKEKTVSRVGSREEFFHQFSPHMPYLEILVPKDAAFPIKQVIFETVSHDQGRP